MAYFYSAEKNNVLKVNVKDYEPMKDTNILSSEGVDQEDIKIIVDYFNNSTKDKRLTKEQFSQLYNKLRDEDPKRLENIGDIIYNAFDANKVINIS